MPTRADDLMATAPTTPSPSLTIEAIVAVETPGEFRLHPRDRIVAYTAEAAGARQLFTLSLRGGYPVQITASEKPVSDPQWSPDGRRLAFVRDEEIWVVEADGSRLTRVVGKPGGGRAPRWSPDGRRLAFLSRRRGWTQVWLIDAPVPRRGRPATEPKPPRPTALTDTGIDVDAFEWSPDGAPDGGHGRARGRTSTDRPDRVRRRRDRRARASSPASGASTSVARWLPRRLAPVRVRRRRLVPGRPPHRRRPRPDRPDRRRARARRAVRRRRLRRRCRRPTAAASSTSRSTTASRTSSSATSRRPAPPKRGRGRPPKTPRTVSGGDGRQPDQPVGRRLAVGRLAARRRVGRRGRRERDRAAGPVAAAGARRRARRRAAAPGHRFDAGGAPRRARARPRGHAASGSRSRPATACAIEGTLWRPHDATGKRGGRRVPTIVYPHGGPTGQSFRSFQPFKQLLVARGLRLPRRRLPRLDRLRPRVPPRQPRRVGPRRRLRPDRCRALGRRAAVVGRPAGDLRRLVRRLHGPVRARRGAGDVAGRRRPVRRLGDRRELPPRRPAWAGSTSTR